MILTAAVIVMILVAMSYANNILDFKIAQNEYESNKQFMKTTAQQMDNLAWTIGRTQTVTYSSRFGNVKLQEAVLEYSVSVHTSSGWETLTLPGETGIVLFNMPVSTYSMGNNYFQRVPVSANSSFLLFDSSAPVSQVICVEKLSMNDGNYLRVALVPTIRVLQSSIAGSQNLKFYLPSLQSGESKYLSQSLTLAGSGISKVTCDDVDQVAISVTFPKAAELGFDESFFNFNSTTVTWDTPSSSIVEFYVGKVQVSIGAV
jgi:hypothetical protein